jgi:transposase
VLVRFCNIVPGQQSGLTLLFVLTLGYSRKSVCLLAFRSGTRVWAELHEKAFRRLGGATRLLLFRNGLSAQPAIE